MEKLTKTMMTIFAVAILMMPVLSIGGNLEPSGPPAPTMKTLDEIPPTWSLTLPGAQRFVHLSTYVTLDKETGLVWTRLLPLGNHSWANSQELCRKMIVGYRMGWRLPTIEELTSLLESGMDFGLNIGEPPASAWLPSEAPFSAVLDSPLWSTTSSPNMPSEKLKVDLNTGLITSHDPATGGNAICVRGGAGFEN